MILLQYMRQIGQGQDDANTKIILRDVDDWTTVLGRNMLNGAALYSKLIATNECICNHNPSFGIRQTSTCALASRSTEASSSRRL